MKKTLSMCFVGLAIGLGACGSSGEDEESISQDCPTSSTLTYENFGRGFMNKYCASCHGGTVKGDARMDAPEEDVFDTIDQIRADKGELYEQVVTTKEMPDKASSRQPSLDERKQFGDWLACGAPSSAQ